MHSTAVTSRRYRLFGLEVESELACPELWPGRPATPAAIRFTLGPPAQAIDSRFDGSRASVEFSIAEVATYHVTGGSQIEVRPSPGADWADVRLYLLGSAMGALLHQRGVLPLHASAVELDGGAYAFCGASGAGKSSLAAALHLRGLRVLCDDTGAITCDDGGARFAAGFPRIKLWPDALEHLEIDTAGLRPDHSRGERRQLDLTRGGVAPAAAPLRAVYLLATAVGEPHIEPLSAAATCAALMRHTYRKVVLAKVSSPAAHFRQCAAIAAKIRAFRFSRPRDLSQFERAADLLVDHLAQQRADAAAALSRGPASPSGSR
jgi:hypothetical protein